MKQLRNKPLLFTPPALTDESHPNSVHQYRRRMVSGALAVLGVVPWLSGCGGGAAKISEPVPGSTQTPTPPPLVPTGNIVQFLTSDGGTEAHSENFSGPTRDRWHYRLGFQWKRLPASGALVGRGNWLDSAQVEEGATPYSSTGVASSVGQSLSVTVTTLVQRWLKTGLNRGFYLNARASAWPLGLYGRGDAIDGNRPKLTVTTDLGTFSLTAVANASWSVSSYAAAPGKNGFRMVANSQPAILRFDLSSITGNVSSAVLTIVVSSFDTGHTGHILDVFEADPPTIIVPENVVNPVLGLANAYVDFNALKNSSNSALIAADDFELGGPFDRGFTPVASRVLNPASKTTYARGEITVGEHASANSRLNVSQGTGPQGEPNVVRDELFGQYSVYLESDFGTTQDDAIKFPALGLQFGWWNSVGYWQSTTGNGGKVGTGLKVDRGGGQTFEYQGHSVRFITGTAPRPGDDDPYNGWFGVAAYVYNLDQIGQFPGFAPFPMVAIRKERWYTFDIRAKQNTMRGTQDALGNYATANADGIYQVWINGYAVFSKTNYRWRRHAEFGVQGMWINVYHGGTSLAPSTMHYRLDRVVVATAYIGPMVGA